MVYLMKHADGSFFYYHRRFLPYGNVNWMQGEVIPGLGRVVSKAVSA
jgi:hypothetical protein